MKKDLYFPNYFKKIGLVLFTVGFTLWMLIIFHVLDENSFKMNVFSLIDDSFGNRLSYCQIIENELWDETIGILCIVGLMFIGFSKEKKEDEFIQKLRLNALKWAVVVNYSLLLFSLIFVYGFMFFNVMIYNMFTILIIYIIRFNYLLFKNKTHVE